MQVVSLCPLSVGSLLWPHQPGAWSLTVVCKATFALSPGSPVLASPQDRVLDDDRGWEDARSLYAASDLALYKPSCDVVLVGHSYAPKREPSRGWRARLALSTADGARAGGRVALVDKTLDVLADRVREPDGSVRELARATRVPLRYERAAGGEGTVNPVGVPDGAPQLPNLVLAASEGERAAADAIACFGPLAASWPLRRARVGDGVEAALRHARAPGGAPTDRICYELPDGLEYEFFNSAPVDQRVDAIGEGDLVELENLHPLHPKLAFEIPPVRPRAFIERGVDADEIALVCDTLWIDTDRAVFTLAWRGRVELPGFAERGRVVVTAEPTGEREAARAVMLAKPVPVPAPAAAATPGPAVRDVLGTTQAMVKKARPAPSSSASSAPTSSSAAGAKADGAPKPSVIAVADPVTAEPELPAPVSAGPGGVGLPPPRQRVDSVVELLENLHEMTFDVDADEVSSAAVDGLRRRAELAPASVSAPSSRPRAQAIAVGMTIDEAAPASKPAADTSAGKPSADTRVAIARAPSPSPSLTMTSDELPLVTVTKGAAASPSSSGPRTVGDASPPWLVRSRSSGAGADADAPAVTVSASTQPAPDLLVHATPKSVALRTIPSAPPVPSFAATEGPATLAGAAPTSAIASAAAPSTVLAAGYPAAASPVVLSSAHHAQATTRSPSTPPPPSAASGPATSAAAASTATATAGRSATLLAAGGRSSAKASSLDAAAPAPGPTRAPERPTLALHGFDAGFAELLVGASLSSPGLGAAAEILGGSALDRARAARSASEGRRAGAVLAVLESPATPLAELEPELARALRSGAPTPLVVVAGELEPSFDELARLRALVLAAAPVIAGLPPAPQGTRGLRAVAESAAALLSAVAQHAVAASVSADAAARLAAELRAQLAAAPPGLAAPELDASIARGLSLARAYDTRALFGGQVVRASLAAASTSAPPFAAYVPAALASMLPLHARFPARLVAELVPAVDPVEPHPVALRVLAIARVI